MTVSGFTLLEMLFAVIIFSFALVSLITITGKGVAATSSAKEQLTAQYLAEELIEVGRNMRDHNYLNYGVADWFDELEACTGTNVVCDIADYSVAPLLTPCTSNPGGVCGVLDNNQGQFRSEAGTGDTTTFERGLTITKSADGQQAIMTATVRWKQKNLGRVYVLQTSLANWQ